MNDAIADAFNGTILYAPVKTIVGCVIEDKLIKIEKGLTWIHDNAEITLPRVNDDYITDAWNDKSNSTDGSSSVVSKASTLVNETEDLMGKMLKVIIKEYTKSLMFELYISLVLLGIWALQFLIGLIILYLNRCFHNSNENMGVNNMNISYPRQLTAEEQEMYGYPLTGNLRVVNLPKDPFTNDAQIYNDPFSDEHKIDENDDKMDSKSTLTTEKLVSSRRVTKVTNPFDEFEGRGVSRVLSRYEYDDEDKGGEFNEKDDL